MNTSTKNFFLRTTILLGIISSTFAGDFNTARIDELTGLKGKMNEKEGVYKVTFPRSEVKVVVDGWTMPPFMGLGTWAAFTATKDGAMVMGDTVLFEDEVNAAMTAALDNGLNVTALHNHFFFDKPKVFFMHIEGEGSVDQLANAVRKVYDAVKKVRSENSQPKDSFGGSALPDKNSISAEPLNKIFGAQGDTKDARREDRQHNGREHVGGLRRRGRQRGSRRRFRCDGRRVTSRLEIARETENLHRRDSPTYDARTTAHHVFPLLGSRSRQRVGRKC